jgi:hypothetical protein
MSISVLPMGIDGSHLIDLLSADRSHLADLVQQAGELSSGSFSEGTR